MTFKHYLLTAATILSLTMPSLAHNDDLTAEIQTTTGTAIAVPSPARNLTECEILYNLTGEEQFKVDHKNTILSEEQSVGRAYKILGEQNLKDAVRFCKHSQAFALKTISEKKKELSDQDIELALRFENYSQSFALNCLVDEAEFTVDKLVERAKLALRVDTKVKVFAICHLGASEASLAFDFSNTYQGECFGDALRAISEPTQQQKVDAARACLRPAN